MIQKCKITDSPELYLEFLSSKSPKTGAYTTSKFVPLSLPTAPYVYEYDSRLSDMWTALLEVRRDII